MSEINNLLNDIEKLRENLLQIIRQKDGDLLDPDVISASQLLNSMITEYNKIIEKKLNK